MSGFHKYIGYLWLALLGVAGIFAVSRMLKTRSSRKDRHAEMGDVSPVALKALDAMCHVAIADGEIDESEVGAISYASEKLTGQAFSSDKVLRMIKLSQQNPSDSVFSGFGKGLSATDRQIVMRGVLMVAAADGNLAGKEQEFVGKLAKALKISIDDVKLMLAELTAPSSPTNAAPA